MAKIVAATAAFDEAAATYDGDFEPAAGSLRALMLDAMLRTFRPGDRILDVNCGTGTDAIALASRGLQVTATDGSAEMIAAMTRKIAALPPPLAAAIDPRVLPFDDLRQLPAGHFDGAVSNFGGLNCAEDLPDVLRAIARLLRPGAGFVACLLNKYALWEFAAYAARLDFRRALRRHSAAAARVGAQEIAVRYYSPAAFIGLLPETFAVEEVFGLSIVSPPPSSRTLAARHPHLTRRLERLDDTLRFLPVFRSLGDHFAIVGRRQ